MLNGLGNVKHFSSFAALLKILHLVPAYIRWLLENFYIELLDPRESALVRVEPPTTDCLEFLIIRDGGLYANDAVLRPKGNRRDRRNNVQPSISFQKGSVMQGRRYVCCAYRQRRSSIWATR